MKKKTCKICRADYTPISSLSKTCSVKCAIEYARFQEQGRQRKEIKQKKQELKTRSDWLKEAQQACNAYIRYRDKDEPCISCGRYHQGQYHAGHYKTVGANPELRFNELNIHKQCAPCNDHLSGNIGLYRPNLEKKIGLPMLEWLEGPHTAQKWSIEDIQDIKQYYKDKLKDLKREEAARLTTADIDL